MHLKRWENVNFVVGMAQPIAAVFWFVSCQAGHRPTSLHPNLRPFAMYNHAFYNIEILIKLLTFLFYVYKRFFFKFCSVLYVFKCYFFFKF